MQTPLQSPERSTRRSEIEKKRQQEKEAEAQRRLEVREVFLVSPCIPIFSLSISQSIESIYHNNLPVLGIY
jgi:hypothetical protein